MTGRVRALLLSAAVGLVGVVAAAPAQATFPGTNGRIAFSEGVQVPTDDLSVPSQIFTIEPNGTGLAQLTNVAGGQTAALPDISADGKRIVFESNASGPYEIWVMNADGSGQAKLTHRSGFEAFQPSWSPDGAHIVFSSCGEPLGFPGYCDIDVMNADGTGVHRLVGGHRYHLRPEYSPNGNRIVFSSDRKGLISALWAVRSDGSKLKRLTPPHLEAFWPDWAPNGKRVLFTDNCCRRGSNVRTVRAGGGGVKRITHFGARLADRAFASYSPDGRRIVFFYSRTCSGSPCGDVFTMAANGSRRHRVPTGVKTPDPGLPITTDWGPSG